MVGSSGSSRYASSSVESSESCADPSACVVGSYRTALNRACSRPDLWHGIRGCALIRGVCVPNVLWQRTDPSPGMARPGRGVRAWLYLAPVRSRAVYVHGPDPQGRLLVSRRVQTSVQESQLHGVYRLAYTCGRARYWRRSLMRSRTGVSRRHSVCCQPLRRPRPQALGPGVACGDGNYVTGLRYQTYGQQSCSITTASRDSSCQG